MPVVYRLYWLSHSEKEIVRNMIKELLDAEINEESALVLSYWYLRKWVVIVCEWTIGP